MTNTDDQRAAFEALAKDRDMHLHRAGHNYQSIITQEAWLAWQAAIEHAKKTMCNRN